MIISLEVPRGRRSRASIASIAILAVAAALGAAVWHSTRMGVAPGPTAFVLRPADVQTEDMGSLVSVRVPVRNGLLALDIDAPVPSVYRPDPAAAEITLFWLESPSAACGQVDAIHLDERADAVVVQLSARRQQEASCPADARLATATIHLTMPLGARPVEFPWQKPTGSKGGVR